MHMLSRQCGMAPCRVVQRFHFMLLLLGLGGRHLTPACLLPTLCCVCARGEQLQQVVSETAALKERQETPDPPEALTCIPSLKVKPQGIVALDSQQQGITECKLSAVNGSRMHMYCRRASKYALGTHVQQPFLGNWQETGCYVCCSQPSTASVSSVRGVCLTDSCVCCCCNSVV